MRVMFGFNPGLVWPCLVMASSCFMVFLLVPLSDADGPCQSTPVSYGWRGFVTFSIHIPITGNQHQVCWQKFEDVFLLFALYYILLAFNLFSLTKLSNAIAIPPICCCHEYLLLPLLVLVYNDMIDSLP